MVPGADRPELMVLDWETWQRAHFHDSVLRRSGSIHHVQLPTGLRAWLVTEYDLGKQLLTDERLSKAREPRARLLSRHGTDRSGVGHIAALNSHLLASDPPDHTRLRGLVHKAFTARRVAAMQSPIEARVAGLLDGLDVAADVDLLEEFAYPLTLGVLGDLLGVPEQDRPRLRSWIDDLFTVADPVRRERTAQRFLDYLRQLLDLHRTDEGDGLASELVAVRDGTDRLSEDELVSVLGLLLTAGFETTASLIGNGLSLLLQQPEQLELLRSDPGLVPAAVEELLRFSSPVQLSTPRFSTEEISCGGVIIPAGEIVLVSLLSADRDPGRFASPDNLDIAEKRSPHLAFGHGIHFCLGAALARLEVQAAIGGLLGRFDTITPVRDPGTLRWRRSVVIRGLEQLPVRLGTADSAAGEGRPQPCSR